MFNWLFGSKPPPKKKRTPRKKASPSPVKVRRTQGRVVLVPKMSVHPDDEADALRELRKVRDKYAISQQS